MYSTRKCVMICSWISPYYTHSKQSSLSNSKVLCFCVVTFIFPPDSNFIQVRLRPYKVNLWFLRPASIKIVRLAHVCYYSIVYMLCAKFGSGQSSDCPAQSSDLCFAQQSSDCPHNPRIVPNEVRKVRMEGNPRIARVRRSRVYSTQEIR